MLSESEIVTRHTACVVQDRTRRPRNPDADRTLWERLQIAGHFSGQPTRPTDVARQLRVQPSAVSKYVEGKFPKTANINKLARLHGVRAEWLQSGLGDMVAEEALDEATLELLRLWRALPSEAQERLLASARYENVSATVGTTDTHKALTEEVIARLERGRHKPD